MASFHIAIEASVNVAGGNAPVLDIFVDGSPVASSVGITAVTGTGSQVLAFTLEFDDSVNPYPSALSFRFNAGTGDGGDIVTIEAVRVNGQRVAAGDLTATMLSQGQTAALSAPAAYDYLFGREEPVSGDLGTVTESGTGGDDDDLTGTGGADVIDGLGGADRIRGLGDDDAINGGAGDDTIFGEAGNDIVIAGAGNDRVFGNDGDDLLYGQDDNDILMGNAGNDVLNGGAGNDRLTGHSGDDILFGAAGDDTLIGVSGNNVMYGAGGADRLLGGRDDDIMHGGAGNDILNGGRGDDTLNGDDGDDSLNGGQGADTINGGTGADTAFGDDGDDTLNGGADNDALYGDDGADTLNGDGGDDLLAGGAGGADTLTGGTGNDILHGHSLDAREISQILRDNPGTVFSAQTNSFYQYVNTGTTWTAANAAAQSVTLNGVEGHLATVTSQAENDFIQSLLDTGSSAWLSGSDDGGGLVWTWGGGLEAGLQFSDGNVAVNNMYENWSGGEPNATDTYTRLQQSDGTWTDRADADLFHYVIEWEAGLMADDDAVDILSGGAGSDYLYGYGGADQLNGGADGDLLFGGDGNDLLNGDGGEDLLFGQDGDDTMNGGTGNDFLVGGDGNDTISGGDGDDTIYAGGVFSTPLQDQIDAILAANPGVQYFDADPGDDQVGNFYLQVTANLNWNAALTNAQSTLINGVAGHLAVITSADENAFVASIITGDSWLGGSDAAVEGEWRWGGGPDDGQMYWLGNSSGSAQGGYYENWNGGEPNNSGDEDALEMNNGGGWNDQGTGTTQDSVIEWEGIDLLTLPAADLGTVNTLNGGDGDDTIFGAGGMDTINGGDGDDVIDTGGDDNIVNGGNDNDTITAQGGDDTLNGDAGNDTITGGLGSDVINGGDGDDTLYGDFAFGFVNTVPGWRYEYFDLATSPNTLATAGFTLNGGTDNTNAPTATGITQDLDPDNFDTGNDFALKFETTLTITTGGSYTFTTRSDDGSKLFLDGVEIVDNDGLHGARTRTSAPQTLGPGTYTLEATFFERGGGQVMEVEMSGPDTGSVFVDLGPYGGVSVVSVAGTIGDDILAGGDGQDILYGGDGADTFLFEAISAFNDVDTIRNFSQAENDALDISDILSGLGVNAGNIADYVLIGSAAAGADSYENYVEALNPLVYYRLGEASGVTTATDETGTINGSYLNNADGGVAGFNINVSDTAADFDGSANAVIQVPDDPLFDIAAGTVTAWFNPDDVTGEQIVFSKDGNADVTGQFFLGVGNNGNIVGRLQQDIGGGGGSTNIDIDVQSVMGQDVQAGQWYMLTLAYGAGGTDIYLNDTFLQSFSRITMSSSERSFVIGAKNWSSDVNFVSEYDGQIDEVAWFQSKFNAADVSNLYNAGVNAADTPASGVYVDTTGSGTFGAAQQIASFSDTIDVSDAATMLANGSLII